MSCGTAPLTGRTVLCTAITYLKSGGRTHQSISWNSISSPLWLPNCANVITHVGWSDWQIILVFNLESGSRLVVSVTNNRVSVSSSLWNLHRSVIKIMFFELLFRLFNTDSTHVEKRRSVAIEKERVRVMRKYLHYFRYHVEYWVLLLIIRIKK